MVRWTFYFFKLAVNSQHLITKWKLLQLSDKLYFIWWIKDLPLNSNLPFSPPAHIKLSCKLNFLLSGKSTISNFVWYAAFSFVEFRPQPATRQRAWHVQSRNSLRLNLLGVSDERINWNFFRLAYVQFVIVNQSKDTDDKNEWNIFLEWALVLKIYSGLALFVILNVCK